MARDKFTAKVARYGVLDTALPAGTKSVTAGIGVYAEFALGGVLDAVVQQNDLVIFRVQSYTSEYTGTIQLRKADGVTVLCSIEISTSNARVVSTAMKVTDPNDFLGMRIFGMNHSANGRLEYLIDNTIDFCYADNVNLVDEVGIKRQVDSIFLISGAGEGINGTKSEITDNAFTECVINGIMDSFTWSANSGKTLYSWSGYSIGVEP